MPNIRVNGISLEYEEFGEQSATPLLLIMGLGAQMVRWPEAFYQQLAGRGFRVIRYDNRDVGLSTKFHEQCPDPGPLLGDVIQGKSVDLPYTLDDMADDAAGLLQALGIPAAHVVGASLGGYIAQLFAIHHPRQMLTLTSIMSSTGDPDLPQPEPETMALLAKPVPAEREARVQQSIETSRALNGPGFAFDEARSRAMVELSLDRDPDPTGGGRQMLAIVSSGSRREALGNVKAPTLVIHGDADPLVPIAGGYATAEAIPGAKMLVIEGMGHSQPEGAWPLIIDSIVELAQSSQPAEAS
ncbi:MAG: alpha/beta hydrolase [Chloroflexi bacterium]|nr:alpha/beta hydrolase [Chloroflexota bacterium]